MRGNRPFFSCCCFVFVVCSSTSNGFVMYLIIVLDIDAVNTLRTFGFSLEVTDSNLEGVRYIHLYKLSSEIIALMGSLVP
jgi:hypothetical protein